MPLDSPYALHRGMLKSCSEDVVHIREFIMLACACTCVPLTHAQNTSVSLILPPLPTPPKVVLRKSFKLKKVRLLIFSETETFYAKSRSVETIQFFFWWQLEILDNSQFSRPLRQRGCTEVSLNRLWQKCYYCDYIREL